MRNFLAIVTCAFLQFATASPTNAANRVSLTNDDAVTLIKEIGTWPDTRQRKEGIAAYTKIVDALSASSDASWLSVAVYNRGFLYMEAGDTAKALEDFDRWFSLPIVLEGFQPRILALSCRGDLLKRLGRYQEAIRDYGEAAANCELGDPNQCRFIRSVGEARLELNQIEWATASFQCAGVPAEEIVRMLTERAQATFQRGLNATLGVDAATARLILQLTDHAENITETANAETAFLAGVGRLYSHNPIGEALGKFDLAVNQLSTSDAQLTPRIYFYRARAKVNAQIVALDDFARAARHVDQDELAHFIILEAE
jgi:tetratricopeptide (TPR) repeat protein